jgi:hypothetical protein
MRSTEEKSGIEDIITREEMNIVEYPISLLSKKIPKGVTKIEYTDWVTIDGKKRALKWIVSGSEEYGLPVGGDQDIYVAIMETWREDGFKDRMIPIGSIYKILKKIGLPPSTRNYLRFKQSLDRLTGIYITAENAFWDKAGQCYLSRSGFGVFDDYQLVEKPRMSEGENGSAPFGFIRANEFFFQSVKNGYLKGTNLTFFLSLSGPLSKRIYRYLDKKRYHASSFSIELYKFSDKIGLMAGSSSKYYPSEIKKILSPAFDELKEKGFLKSYVYSKTSDSMNEKIVFVFTEWPQTANPLTFDTDEDYWIKPILEDIIHITGAEHSVAWYTRTLRILGQDRSRHLIYHALSLTKEALNLQEIKTTRDQYFISTLMRLCRESGIDISSQPS